ncbi:DNA ligase (NAD+) [Thalassotalea piscium]|uniref:DNA ligase (NAD(+)) n=2 Tax=Thalassotalea piscium TaxID=1230533 RepID=A0A7X0TTC6_9GAMM|nr:DNA ligase (NAD+) [Thalassotalea piscium]
MLSTDKAYTLEDVKKWLSRVIKAGQQLGVSASDIVIECTSKFDGIAARYDHTQKLLVTRGDGLQGTNISNILSGLKIVGDKYAGGVGEIVMKNHYFDQYFSKEVLGENGFVDSRGFIAGMSNQDVLDEHRKFALDNGMVELLIYTDVDRSQCNAEDFIEQYEAFEKKHLKSEYMLDGVVFDVVNADIKALLGSTSHHPVWRLAKKQIKGLKETVVENIRWQVGRTKVITPVLEVKSVVLSRVNVTSITGHSLGYLKKHQLGVGAKILANRSGDVVPTHQSTISGVEPEYPTLCPCCNAKTFIRVGKSKGGESNDFLMCSNEECGGSQVSYLFDAFKRLGIDLFGRKSCEKLIDGNYTTLESILMMTKQDFIDVGFGQGQAGNFIAEIDRAKREPIKGSHILSSLGIHLLGRKASEDILTKYKIDQMAELTIEKLSMLDGFAKLSAKTIVDGLAAKRDTLKFLLEYGFNIEQTSESNDDASEGALSGLNIVFTGAMKQGSRDVMQSEAKARGAKVQSSVNSRTDYLIIGQKVGQSKMDKAKELGVSILSEDEYIEHFH